MRLTRVYVESALAVGTIVTLPADAAAHLLRVLRLEVGNVCVLFNGDGHDYHARILSTGRRNGSVEVFACARVDNESPLQIVLLQAVARADKMDWIIQKATELGVVGVVPVLSERGEVKLDGDRAQARTLHWRNVATSACAQSGRARVPQIATPRTLTDALETLAPESQRLVMDPTAAVTVRALDPSQLTDLVVAIGPEGGWSPGDLDQLRGAAFNSLRLGPRVLRTETAGLAIIAALQTHAGDFV